MELSELNEEELLALIGLAKLVVRADRDLSDDELGVLDQLADRVGVARWNDATGHAKKMLTSRKDVIVAATGVQRPEAQQAIHAVLKEIAVSDGEIERETGILEWVSQAWQLEA